MIGDPNVAGSGTWIHVYNSDSVANFEFKPLTRVKTELPCDFFDLVEIHEDDSIDLRNEKHLWNLVKYLCQKVLHMRNDVHFDSMVMVLRFFMHRCFAHPEDPRYVWLRTFEHHVDSLYGQFDSFTWNGSNIEVSIGSPDSFRISSDIKWPTSIQWSSST